MNRVSTYNDAQELVFDLCGGDVDCSDIRICALKTSNLSNCCVETFWIANESDSDECKSNDFPSDCSHASLEDISRLYSDDTDWVAVVSSSYMVLHLHGLMAMRWYNLRMYVCQMTGRGNLSQSLWHVSLLLHHVLLTSI